MRALQLQAYLAHSRQKVRARLLAAGADAVEFSVDVDLPQRPVYPIKAIEKIRVEFPTDDGMPRVYALRKDFPSVPHLMVSPDGKRRQLCLYERPWTDVRASWSPRAYVEWIRGWLSGTANGTLHRSDQPLEPVLQHGRERLVLPRAKFVLGEGCRIEQLYIAPKSNGFVDARKAPPPGVEWPLVPIIFVQGPVVHHGIMHRSPATLLELEQLLTKLGGTILKQMAARLAEVREEVADLGNVPLLLVVELPKTRNAGGPVETIEYQAFFIDAAAREFVTSAKTHEKDEITGLFLPVRRLRAENPDYLAKVAIHSMAISWHLDPNAAANFGGYARKASRMVAIGAGALGSQVLANAYRGGFGRWTIIDDDILNPHNPARHHLDSRSVGEFKAPALANDLGAIFPDTEAPTAIVANYLNPGAEGSKIADALKEAEIIFDFSASVAVQRKLARDASSSARRVSVFLNPRGDELVVLVEDEARTTDLSWLEAQFLKAVTDGLLPNHFDVPHQGRLRYGNGCRDLSVVISEESVAVHSGIGAAAIRRVTVSPEASVTVYRYDSKTGGVTSVPIPIAQPIVCELGHWRVLLSPQVVEELTLLRRANLPCETGGVLLGVVDREQRGLAIIGLLPSPPDSEAWPTSFIRGGVGLAAAVERIDKKTLGNVTYVGEWHTHPAGFDSHPSELDKTAVDICSIHMEAEALPTLMLIGADNEIGFVVKPLGENKIVYRAFPPSAAAA